MRNYLLLFVSFTLLLFTMPKNSSMRSFAQQGELAKSCSYSKRFSKKACAQKCLKHQTHSDKQNNAAATATDCNQQVYAVVNALPSEPIIIFKANPDFILPHIQNHLSPVLEHEPEPPRFS